MTTFKNVFAIAIFIGACSAKADTFDQQMRAIKNDPGYRFRILVQNVDVAISSANNHKLAETCAFLGAIGPQFDAIKSAISPMKQGGPLDLATVKSFSITGFCGVKFLGSDVIKEGDTQTLVTRLQEIGELVIASARVAHPLDD